MSSNIKTAFKLIKVLSQTSILKQLSTRVNNFIVAVLGFSLKIFIHIFIIAFKMKSLFNKLQFINVIE